MVEVGDTGSYMCVAENVAGSAEKHFTLSVEDKASTATLAQASKAFQPLVMGACLPLGIWEGHLNPFFRGNKEGMSPPNSPCALQSPPALRLHPIPLRCPSLWVPH